MGSPAPGADVVSDYVESNMGDRFAEAARYVRSCPEQLRLLGDLLPQIFTPVQIITGCWDPLVPLTNAEYLHARLPNSRLDVLDTGHFVWEGGTRPVRDDHRRLAPNMAARAAAASST